MNNYLNIVQFMPIFCLSMKIMSYLFDIET